jgi:uncharacterized protein with FMN-binding domain
MKQFFSILALSLLIVSCSKSKNEVTPPPATVQPTVHGFWKGSYDGSGAYAFLLRPDGTMRVYANSNDTAAAKKADGIYVASYDKNTFTGTYKYISTGTNYTITATMNTSVTEIKGNYKQIDGNAAGTFLINKQ